MLKRWIARLATTAQIAVITACMLFAITWFGAAPRDTAKALLLTMSLMIPATLVHELGHYAAARLAGMTVLQLHIYGIAVLARRRGWALRWAGFKHRRYAAFVVAFPKFGRAMRPQMLAMLFGGPAANLAVATSLFAAQAWLRSTSVGDALLAFASINAGVGLANLIPAERVPGAATDGKKLIAWLRKPDPDTAPFAYLRVVSRVLDGQLAGDIPESDLVGLEQQTAPMRLFALAYRLKARQERGDWVQAAALSDGFAALWAAQDAPMRTACAELAAFLQVELAFSQAMSSATPEPLDDPSLPLKTLWSAPWLPRRCQALQAALRGDSAECQRLLGASQRRADNCVDRSVHRSEALIREHIRALQHRLAAAAVTGGPTKAPPATVPPSPAAA